MPDAQKRIQRRRTKGWRMPEGAVYVGRPTKWGNPYNTAAMTRPEAVRFFRARCERFMRSEVLRNDILELRGKDLACWCTLDQECHADVLLEMANA